ncbi:MAG: transcription termination factor, partial [Bacteroidales bacterium]|nr:transcription termination factor [Bacteroidales bacterium]
MLNRRILRIKAFKVLYGYSENPGMTLAEAEAMLEASCEATRDLYLYMLLLIPALTQEAKDRMETARNRFNATKEDLQPNLKFIENSIAPLIADDPDFQKLVSKKKLSWEPYDALIRSLFKTISEKEYFKKYMASEERSLSQDAALFVKIFEEELVDNDSLEKILEDLSILWIDDLA